MKRTKPAPEAVRTTSRRPARSNLAKAVAADELLISTDPRQIKLRVFTRSFRRWGLTK